MFDFVNVTSKDSKVANGIKLTQKVLNQVRLQQEAGKPLTSASLVVNGIDPKYTGLLTVILGEKEYVLHKGDTYNIWAKHQAAGFAEDFGKLFNTLAATPGILQGTVKIKE